MLTHRTGDLCLDKAFVLIEGHPPVCYLLRMNDLVKDYASMPVEDIKQLALDTSSLTPEASAALRLEMERRRLPTHSLEAAAQQKEPKPVSWVEDWKNTDKGGARCDDLALSSGRGRFPLGRCF